METPLATQSAERVQLTGPPCGTQLLEGSSNTPHSIYSPQEHPTLKNSSENAYDDADDSSVIRYAPVLEKDDFDFDFDDDVFQELDSEHSKLIVTEHHPLFKSTTVAYVPFFQLLALPTIEEVAEEVKVIDDQSGWVKVIHEPISELVMAGSFETEVKSPQNGKNLSSLLASVAKLAEAFLSDAPDSELRCIIQDQIDTDGVVNVEKEHADFEDKQDVFDQALNVEKEHADLEDKRDVFDPVVLSGRFCEPVQIEKERISKTLQGILLEPSVVPQDEPGQTLPSTQPLLEHPLHSQLNASHAEGHVEVTDQIQGKPLFHILISLKIVAFFSNLCDLFPLSYHFCAFAVVSRFY